MQAKRNNSSKRKRSLTIQGAFANISHQRSDQFYKAAEHLSFQLFFFDSVSCHLSAFGKGASKVIFNLCDTACTVQICRTLKMVVKGMNSGHAKMADRGISHLLVTAPEEILDIGCGGGRNAAELLKRYPDSKLTAIELSPLSVEQATAYNKDAISAARCVVQQ